MSPEYYQKTEGRLDRSRLRGILGDQMNALMTAIGYNLRLILRALSFWLKIIKERFADWIGYLNQTNLKAVLSA
ncbi:hypothetical protein [uncultured Desulfuromusa sp.]|uniref:hypothetical protein n=1 Tax=uncultured Desulfuromusa sp. TaxID=219183 RepID=UPI002AA8B2C1|nr:hypothetical protein [uncultured Desulfuromusa sp.]